MSRIANGESPAASGGCRVTTRARSCLGTDRFSPARQHYLPDLDVPLHSERQVTGGTGMRMTGTRHARRVIRAATSVVVPILVLVLSLAAAVVLPASPAQAATVSIGTIQGQLADHRGRDTGTGGQNCITYAPVGSATSSSLVASPNEAQTGHGSPNTSGCPSSLSTSTQSVVGFRPSSVTSATDGAQFLIGRMVHYNNPVYSSDEFFTGNLRAVLGGFTAPNTLTFPWTLDETPNTGSGNCCDDLLTFNNQISTQTLTQGGLTFRLVVKGFVPVATATTCPPSPIGTPVNEFKTVEGTQTHACLYASLQQTRTLTVTKNTSAGSPPRSFAFTSNSALDGSPWSNGTWNLTSGASETRDLVSGNTVTVTENDPGDDRWSMTNLACQQYAADGVTLLAVPGATVTLAARKVVLDNIPPPLSATRPGITCTYTNTYTPKATLTLAKTVQSGSATPNLWTLTATGSAAAPPAGTSISGPAGSAAVTAQRVPAGSYSLSEVATGSASTGYAQVGDWLCRTQAGATVPVTNGVVTLSDAASTATPATVTCTATNRFATGSLQISKVIDDPNGGYTGGTTKTFSGTYDCGTGFTGGFSTLTTTVPVAISNIPAGRQCTVTETPPTGGLANASFTWGTPDSSAQPVVIPDQGNAQVTITNHVVQGFGSLTVSKVIDGPGGYTGGNARPFPGTYRCTLTGGPTTSGPLTITTSTPGGVTNIPAGSVCTFAETPPTTQPGDFSDPSYAWTGTSVTPPVVIAKDQTSSITITNTYAREFGSLLLSKVVQGNGYLGGVGENFTVQYDCGTGYTGQVTLAAGGSKPVSPVPARTTCTVQEVPPAASLLSSAYQWGTPTWSPSAVATIPANGSATLTVTNPTVAIFGQVAVTKNVTGETDGVTGSARFDVRVACGATFDQAFTLAPGATAQTPDLPVGTVCTVTETPPTSGLIDSSYAWGPSPGPQQVTVTTAGQVVPVSVTNTVVRVRGSLTIVKAPIQGGAGVVDPARTYAIGFDCVYGADPHVTGTVSRTAGQAAAVIPNLLLGSSCTVTEDPASLSAPPSATDPSWVWLPPAYSPGQTVPVTSATTPVGVTVTNAIKQVTGRSSSPRR